MNMHLCPFTEVAGNRPVWSVSVNPVIGALHATTFWFRPASWTVGINLGGGNTLGNAADPLPDLLHVSHGRHFRLG